MLEQGESGASSSSSSSGIAEGSGIGGVEDAAELRALRAKCDELQEQLRTQSVMLEVRTRCCSAIQECVWLLCLRADDVFLPFRHCAPNACVLGDMHSVIKVS